MPAIFTFRSLQLLAPLPPGKDDTSLRCMIKIFWGAGVVTPSTPPPPYEQHLPLPNPCLKMFLERSLNDPQPPNPTLNHPTSNTLHCYPLSIHHPFPPQKKILIIHKTGFAVHRHCCKMSK